MRMLNEAVEAAADFKGLLDRIERDEAFAIGRGRDRVAEIERDEAFAIGRGRDRVAEIERDEAFAIGRGRDRVAEIERLRKKAEFAEAERRQRSRASQLAKACR